MRKERPFSDQLFFRRRVISQSASVILCIARALMLLYPFNVNKMSQNEQEADQNQAEVSRFVTFVGSLGHQHHS